MHDPNVAEAMVFVSALNHALLKFFTYTDIEIVEKAEEAYREYLAAREAVDAFVNELRFSPAEGPDEADGAVKD
jgi:hypothetical protein